MPASPKTHRNHCKTVLQLIQRSPGITKPQIAQRTGLMVSAVHGIMAFLEEKEVIKSAGIANSSGGRRAGLYDINASLGVVAGVSVRIDRVDIGIFDLKLRLLHKASVQLSLGEMGPETYASLLGQAIASEMDKSGFLRKDFFGVGVTVPGPVDVRLGTVLEIAAAPLWQQYPLANRLSDALGLPVLADKDVYAGIRYLAFSGKMRTKSCTAFLTICEGISAALLINGEVFRGSHSLSGEIGHLTVRKDGIPCTCGNTGCLELYCSDIGIVKQYNAQTGGACAHVADVIALSEKGDPVARKVFSQAVGYLVETTSTIIMNYDPEELLIYCTWLHEQRALFFRMLDVLYAKTVFTKRHAVDIRLLEPEPINLPAAAALVTTELIFQSGSRLAKILEEGE